MILTERNSSINPATSGYELQHPEEPAFEVLPLRVAEQDRVVRGGVQLLKKLDIPARPS